ncbi:hypothetical protein DVR12_17080 [Chitinophaga silvatica]|uniref:Glycosyltransferase RgtA/B/C/D-like domain-containing protein n=1 Tax=Chitinophaga silvatica TaxID=2282649 RepID=A0A3E1Y7K8_9BACT|nr:hypothetical protein [Chitinophaga silvatica]RFS21054.1 hypothetical protein DVR12_17080 [Chitinophaga silvatica]
MTLLRLKDENNFLCFLLANNRNRLLAAVALLSIIVKIVIFKYFYPHADYTPDSDSYIVAAISKFDVDLWPIGYSKFLGLFHHLSNSETLLVTFQYCFLELSTYLFFFSFLYILKEEMFLHRYLFPFLIINPIFLFISNYIITESLFIGLSIIWFTLLLWILYRPSLSLILIHGLVLSLAFTIRYNAIFYPVVSLIAILLISSKWWIKIIGIILPIILIGMFIRFTVNKTYERTNVRQFSVFGSWQLANNALYQLPYLPFDTTGIPRECKLVHKLAYDFYRSEFFKIKDAKPAAGAYYMWDPHSPLNGLKDLYAQKFQLDDFTARSVVAPIYKEYASYLIKKYPINFLRYYLCPNIMNYLIPDLEMIKQNNRIKYKIALSNPGWFKESKRPNSTTAVKAQEYILYIFPYLFPALHLLLIKEALQFYINNRRKKNKQNQLINKSIFIALAFFIINAAFSIVASPVVFRYQIPVYILMITFILFLIEKNLQEAKPAS